MAENKTTVNITWSGGAEGNGALKAGYLDTQVALPKNHGGSGDGADPKELLVSSAATCFTLTLTAILDNRDLPVVEYRVDSEARSTDDRIKINHKPKIVLSAEATEDQVATAERAIESADRACTIGNLLKKAGVTIEFTSNVSVE